MRTKQLKSLQESLTIEEIAMTVYEIWDPKYDAWKPFVVVHDDGTTEDDKKVSQEVLDSLEEGGFVRRREEDV